MKKVSLKYFLGLSLSVLIGCSYNSTNSIDLEGEWIVKLDSLDVGENEKWFENELSDELTIHLPSTLDKAGIGEEVVLEPKLNRETLFQLTRKRSYIGPAWYQREIDVPAAWENKDIVLEMERVIWKSQVWIDGEYKGSDNSLVTSHKLKLGKLSKGKHLITICIDNRQQYDLCDTTRNLVIAHAYTETTQTIWNGILGDFKLRVVPDFSIENLQVYPDVAENSIKIEAQGSGNSKENIQFIVRNEAGIVLAEKTISADKTIRLEIKDDFEKWSEHNPKLYSLQVTNSLGETLKEVPFGLRKIEAENNNLFINGKRLFLRGTLECSIFPRDGHPPLDDAGWEKVFKAAKEYGLNHLRFHSWCPPKAAFRVADKMGFYLQVELPNWSLRYGEDKDMVRWMEKEGWRMIKEYGNHPSFCFMSMGNELEGDYDLLSSFMEELKEADARHLYTVTSFTFQKPQDAEPQAANDFWITQWTKEGWVRGQGVFDTYSPSFDKDFRSSIEFIDIPLITHEIGQYSVFPNPEEIKKYDGVLAPLNFEAIKTDLEKKGRLDKAGDYQMASGHFAKILYKEEIERAFKTPGISGFQLLDLHDFPGQGTALVGMLDAFWDSKGIITGAEFREFCSEFVPLLKFEKATYSCHEIFTAKAEVSNYWKDLGQSVFEWQISMNNQNLNAGELLIDKIPYGSYAEIGTFDFELKEIKEPVKLDVTLRLKGTEYTNTWPIWVYPQIERNEAGKVLVTSDWQKAEEALSNGEKVLLTPKINELKGIEGKFVPVFWSPVHFPNQPGTMGLLINNKHQAFASFPTEFHSNWQWWDLCKQSKSLEMEKIEAERIVTVIDNFAKNRDLSNLFEARVGKGLLVFSAMDLHSKINDRIVAKTLRQSIMNYMESTEFSPSNELTFEQIKSSFQLDPNAQKLEKKSIYDN
ncbi:sugar-binding domain-containing protein [Carboxylicivirga sp. M1479]|uniref:sugar-binding domain-containing protein n=1 Tax=Carboxylicivirga sp. M1479 TaxID=2594476 RepID=UPI001177B9FE|nr:sugar-binding domain-containing protein [Carboxylicivirga sp. M1479]TRX71160.1 glycoside hydrolase family 2 [Carboxylicivirga sp. M1479]